MRTIITVCSVLIWSMVGADSYPSRPIRFINPTAPGGTAEPVARVLAQRMSEILGQTLVVDSRGGAGGTMGTLTAARAPADGYTVLLGIVSPMAINVSLFGAQLPYNPLRDFAPISLITRIPQMLTVHPGVPAQNIKELIALAKDPKHTFNYGSAGSGTTGHLVGELLNKTAGIQVTHIPFKGSGPALAAALSGQVAYFMSGPPAVIGLAQSGRLRPLAGSGVKRSPSLPDVPTFIESGLAIDITAWYCVVVPARTPQPIVTRLNAAVVESLRSAQVGETLLKMGAPPEPTTTAELRQFLVNEVQKFAVVVKLSGAKID